MVDEEPHHADTSWRRQTVSGQRHHSISALELAACRGVEVNSRAGSYSTPVWNVVEYVGLFVIIMLHEFGHTLACRSGRLAAISQRP